MPGRSAETCRHAFLFSVAMLQITLVSYDSNRLRITKQQGGPVRASHVDGQNF